ncbi:uro-adherence factor A isoform X2 [Parasteatoda tepidariorum]|uniref:uro-adherence factor A isoform X2 n=1 Tax=Parasteatoda tepidariorum TaxID=114398 RepID=UPI001C71ABEA|nr:uncharacterized protein LOC107451153 isoform X2 [Parasteatoda tepidariorum]
MAEQNSYDFWTRYSNLCLKCKVCPLKSVIKHMKGTTLCCPVERIRSEHWQFLLSALSVDNSLTRVQFKSDLPSLEEQEALWKRRRRKKDESYPCPYGYSSHNISDICKYTARLLTVSQTLQTLILENLPITKEDALHLAEGLKSTLLKEFSLRCYPFSDEVIEIVCRGLWDSNVFLIDFSACNLSLEGLNSIRNVILKHKARRNVQVFPDTLRYRLPVFEKMMGLTRIIFNGNNIGDKGVNMICEAVSDDRWIQALDLQCCGITNEGAKAILEQITANNVIQLVDLRLNEIAGPILDRISLQLGVNSFGKLMNFPHLPLWKPRSFSKAIPVRKNKLKTKVSKKYSVAKKIIRKETKSLEQAFRISCEIIDSKEGSTKDAMVQTNVLDEVKHLKFKSENLKLRHLNETLRRENMNLRQEIMRNSSSDSAILIDKETYTEIKHVFEKFQRFFKLMKDNGLWDLVSTIGVAEYENTRLKAVPSESKVCFVEKVDVPPDGCPSNGPILKQQRNCSCHNPACISNQKAEKENNVSIVNQAQKFTEERVQLKMDKAKVSKVFKDIRETYTNCDFGKQVPPPHRSTRKYSLGDVQAGSKSFPTTKPLSLKCVLNRDIPDKFMQIQTREDFYEAIRSEMEKIECACQLHTAPKSPDKSSQSVKNQTNVNNKGFFKNVSSQTAAVESLSNFKGQNINNGSASSGASQKNVEQSNSPSSAIRKGISLKRTLSLVSREWDEHVKKNFPDCNIEQRGTAAGAEGSNSILVNPGYFKSRSSKDLAITKDISTPAPSQGTSKSTSRKTVNLFSSNSVESEHSVFPDDEIESWEFPDEQKGKIKSTQTPSNVDSSSKSYLESVSDASTDKDVKSLSGSELYESVKSDSVNSRSSNKSIAQKAVSVSSGNPGDAKFAKGDSVNSKSSNKSKAQKAVSQSGGNPGVINSMEGDSVNSKSSNKSKAQKATSDSGGNPGVINSVKVPSSTVLSYEVVLSNNSSKSSKRSQKQRKSSNQNASGGRKTEKDNVSSSSVPSLSDITTVSSHSLNTDSVMDQLSESEKGLS